MSAHVNRGEGEARRGPDALGRLILTTILLAAAVFLFLLFYAANEPQRLERLALEDDEQHAKRIAALLPIAELNFMAHCADCHGFEAEGDVAPALRSKLFLDAVTDEVLEETVRNGRPGTDMKPFSIARGGPLDDDDIEGMVALLRSWQQSAPGGEDDPRRQPPQPPR